MVVDEIISDVKDHNTRLMVKLEPYVQVTDRVRHERDTAVAERDEAIAERDEAVVQLVETTARSDKKVHNLPPAEEPGPEEQHQGARDQ